MPSRVAGGPGCRRCWLRGRIHRRAAADVAGLLHGSRHLTLPCTQEFSRTPSRGLRAMQGLGHRPADHPRHPTRHRRQRQPWGALVEDSIEPVLADAEPTPQPPPALPRDRQPANLVGQQPAQADGRGALRGGHGDGDHRQSANSVDIRGTVWRQPLSPQDAEDHIRDDRDRGFGRAPSGGSLAGSVASAGLP